MLTKQAIIATTQVVIVYAFDVNLTGAKHPSSSSSTTSQAGAS